MILIAFGTRPEWIKVKPLIDEYLWNGIVPRLLYVKQHEHIDLEGLEAFVVNVSLGKNRLDDILYSVINSGLWERNAQVDTVLVQGDTATAMAVALSAFHHKKRVAHMEAGLRTYDTQNPWPEESYRRIISSIADVHLCPTERDAANLWNERVSGQIFVTGNTAIDSLVAFKVSCEYTDKVLITLHRRENQKLIKEWFIAIDEIAKFYPWIEFMFPIHWNPEIRQYKSILRNVNVVEPMSHYELIQQLVKTKLVITDSGGLQEECSFFNKKCLVCRQKTERTASVGTSSFMVNSPADLLPIFDNQIKNFSIDFPCPYGDGNSASKIFNVLNDLDEDSTDS